MMIQGRGESVPRQIISPSLKTTYTNFQARAVVSIDPATMEDFEAYLDDDFDARKFARDVIIGTNGSDCDELDLEAGIKRLRFDVDECDKRMATIAGKNYQALVGNFSKVDDLNRMMSNTINPAVEQVNTSFDRIRQEVIMPYDDAVASNEALKRLHTTLALLRGVSVFIVLVQQLEEVLASRSGNDTNEADVLKQARLISQLSQLIEGQSTLTQLRLVRNYQLVLTVTQSNLVSNASTTVVNEVSHTKTFTLDNAKLSYNLLGLYVISPEELCKCIDKIITKNVTSALAQLQRALNSPRNFTEIISEIHETQSNFFNKLDELVTQCRPDGEDSTTTPSMVLSGHFEGKNIITVFWERLGFRFKKNIAATMARGGPIAKNLRSYKDGIESTVNDTFSGEVRDMLTDALLLIKI